MFKFLKNIMNNEEINLTNGAYSIHRVLKTSIKKDPNVEEDENNFQDVRQYLTLRSQLGHSF